MGCARVISSGRLQYAIRRERFIGCRLEYRGYANRRAKKKKGPRDASAALLFDWARGWCVRPDRTRYSGLEMTAQAMRGGAALEAPAATACMTMAVPPLLNTEWSSVPSVTLGATTVA